MAISARILQQAIDLYLAIAYPGGSTPPPPAAMSRAAPIRVLDPNVEVPVALLETDVANTVPSYALRLGQPLYPHMKLVVEPAPPAPAAGGSAGGWLIRVDAHDRHLHAPPDSPDAAWLASIRNSNKDIGERIEAAWSAAHLPTFKDFLREQLVARKAADKAGHPSPPPPPSLLPIKGRYNGFFTTFDGVRIPMNWQQPIARTYTQLPTDEVVERIAARKAELGEKLVILGHHYQQDNVIRFADITGDSFQLSREAAKLHKAQYVVFCGVHFMAESADILTAEHQHVILPDLGAGCSMADMAQLEDVEDAWGVISEICRDLPGFKLVPITYMNSAASIKSFVGEHGGAVCTSSNCDKILGWALGGARTEGKGLRTELDTAPLLSPQSSVLRSQSSGTKVIFFPDQHLGRNTAFKMGYPLESMAVWDYKQAGGGLTEQQIREATFFLWKGHCSVHQLFRPEHVDQARVKYPGIKVIVHPECRYEVVQKADISGSTDLIGKTIGAAPAGSSWAVGTEVHMVNRLAKQFPNQHIVTLSECQCLCTTMYRIDPPHLLWVLDKLAGGEIVNEIKVDPYTRYWARVSLQRMLDITAGSPVSPPPGDSPKRENAGPVLRVLAH